MSVPSLSYLLLSSAAVLLVTAAEASAQSCTKAPDCAELGYTKSVSQYSGKNMIKCPFDTALIFCEDGPSCASLGFTDTVSECPGSYVKCPTDSYKGKCDFEASPGDGGPDSASGSGGVGFDASRSNSIYGRSSTVTPQNYSANVFIYAGRKKY